MSILVDFDSQGFISCFDITLFKNLSIVPILIKELNSYSLINHSSAFLTRFWSCSILPNACDTHNPENYTENIIRIAFCNFATFSSIYVFYFNYLGIINFGREKNVWIKRFAWSKLYTQNFCSETCNTIQSYMKTQSEITVWSEFRYGQCFRATQRLSGNTIWKSQRN